MGRLVSMKELIARRDDLPEAIIEPGLLTVGGIMIVIGSPGVGKSFMVQQMAFELCSGMRWMGLFPTRQVKTAYFEFEKGNAFSRGRFKRPDWYVKYPEAYNNLFFFDEEVLRLDTQHGAQELEKIIVDGGIKLAIIDSFSVTLENEIELTNLKVAISNYHNIARRNKMSMIMIHHINKRGTDFDKKTATYVEPPLNMRDLRGNNYINFEVETIVGISKGKQTNARELVFLKHSFCNKELDLLTQEKPLKLKYYADTPVPYLPSDIKNFEKMMDLIQACGALTIEDIEDQTGWSRPTIFKVIEELEAIGVVEVERGGGRMGIAGAAIPTSVHGI
jgi:biotin operon repressor